MDDTATKFPIVQVALVSQENPLWPLTVAEFLTDWVYASGSTFVSTEAGYVAEGEFPSVAILFYATTTASDLPPLPEGVNLLKR